MFNNLISLRTSVSVYHQVSRNVTDDLHSDLTIVLYQHDVDGCVPRTQYYIIPNIRRTSVWIQWKHSYSCYIKIFISRTSHDIILCHI